MRIVSGLFAAIFVLAAGLQWNDPDPLVWIVGYLAAAVLSGAAALGRTPWAANAVAAAVFGIWFLTLAPTLPGADTEAFSSFEMKASDHEEPREAIGLLLCMGWCGVLAVHGWRYRDEREAVPPSEN